MILFPNCKINMGLNVLRRREDGYHDVQTMMFPVTGLCDSVEVTPSPSGGVKFTQSGLPLDCAPEKNICIKAYELMRERYGIGGVQIHLHKAIPYGAGLGGGSADGSFVIKGLNEIFRFGLDDAELERLAARLGSDTAFFIRNAPSICTGRGEIMTPFDIPALAGRHLLIVKPDIHVSTASAYGSVVPAPAPDIAGILRGDIRSWRDTLRNDFETPVFAAHPVLASIKERLYSLGALYASMSGSGAALYAIFDTPPAHSDWPEGYFLYSQKFS